MSGYPVALLSGTEYSEAMTKKELANKILDRKGELTPEQRNRWFRQLMSSPKAELVAHYEMGSK